MKLLLSHDPMKPGTPSMLILMVGLMQASVLELGSMDRRFEGKLDGGKCVWLKDGRRVEFVLVPGGGYVASTSKETDPEWPGKAVTT